MASQSSTVRERLMDAIWGSWQWTFDSIFCQVPWSANYFWLLTFWSAIVWGLEIMFPWRKEQQRFRKDFGLDLLYMYWNLFGFASIFAGILAVIASVNLPDMTIIDWSNWSICLQLLVFFLLTDFLQYCTHRILHRVDFLWHFHKIHHSVQEMGFAAHLRYHWMETLIYHPVKYAALVVLGGVEPQYAFIVYFGTLMLGHLNHANIYWTWGPLQYVLNSPVQHLWHHAYERSTKNHNCNFAISLSCWDVLFGTFEKQPPKPNISLGFEGMEEIPQTFLQQVLYKLW